MSTLTQVHPTGQALTLVAKKYDLPEEVEKKIQDLVFSNKLPKIDFKKKGLNQNQPFLNYYDWCVRTGALNLTLKNIGFNKLDIHGLKFYYLGRFIYYESDVTVKDLKATLKQLIKYNNLKIPISKLKKNELISLLIHTEF